MNGNGDTAVVVVDKNGNGISAIGELEIDIELLFRNCCNE